ncbi:hypothetical protein TNCV_3526971 [Trichonephila clavipes]|nr:hypothetical protein TNCV_3526971 [Trichonephila clavipes]
MNSNPKATANSQCRGSCYTLLWLSALPLAEGGSLQGGCQLRYRPHHLRCVTNSPSVASQNEVNNHSHFSISNALCFIAFGMNS